MEPFLFILAGAIFGGIIGWFAVKGRLSKALSNANTEIKVIEERNSNLNNEITELKQVIEKADEENRSLQDDIVSLKTAQTELKTTIDKEREAAQKELALLNEAKEKLTDAFKALSKDALESSNKSFIELAEQTFKKLQSDAKGDLEQRKQAVEGLINPIKESLEKQQKLLHDVEKTRQEHYGSITEQLKHLTELEKSLSQETSNLVTALKAPNVRGSWGEQTLRRVVEIAGLNEYCDFTEQESVTTEDGRLRPDLVVRMPGERIIIVDAKNIFQAYYEAMELQDEVKRNALLDKHVRSVKEHIKKLSQKSYWEQFGESADFVIFFMPNENLYTEALKRDPSIFEEAVKQRILPAHPISLAGFLQIIGHTWKQQKMSEYADTIKNLGQELYDRLADLAVNFSRIGSSLETAVDAYNKSVGTLESRVLITARRFKDLGVSGKKDVKELPLAEKAVRQFSKDDLNPKNIET